MRTEKTYKIVSSGLAKFQCEKCKASCFCVNSTFAISQTEFSEFLEVLWVSDTQFSSYKAVIWQLYVVYAYLSYKKGSIKKYYILGIL